MAALEAQRERLGQKARWEDGIPACYKEHDCLRCGTTFRPKRAGRAKFCGRECSDQFRRDSKALRKIVCVSVRVRRSKPKPPKVYYEPIVEAECRWCGSSFDRRSLGASRYMCSQSCADAAAAKARRTGRKKRRALERGAKMGEAIDPLAVFDRDGWRCGVCGCKTQKTKRGTYHPKAPELDHIVALASGGAHTWGNVQCACRECNGKKGAASYGQLHLFPVA